MNIQTDESKTANLEDVGTYFYHLKQGCFPKNLTLSKKSVMLADAMIASVDPDEHLDGFIDINQAVTMHIGRGYFDDIHNEENDGYDRSFGYTGFESRKKTLEFFSANKVAMLEVMDELIETRNEGDIKRFLDGLIPYDMKNLDDVFIAYKGMITSQNEPTEVQKRLQEKIILALVNQVVFHSLQNFESLLERDAFWETFG